MQNLHDEYADSAWSVGWKIRMAITAPGWVQRRLEEKTNAQSEALRTRLRAARESLEWTQVKAAALMGRDQTFISRIEAGQQQPTFTEVEQLARNYGKELSYFDTITIVEQEHPEFKITQALLSNPKIFQPKPSRAGKKSSPAKPKALARESTRGHTKKGKKKRKVQRRNKKH